MVRALSTAEKKKYAAMTAQGNKLITAQKTGTNKNPTTGSGSSGSGGSKNTGTTGGNRPANTSSGGSSTSGGGGSAATSGGGGTTSQANAAAAAAAITKAQKDYAAAYAAGDYAGMRAANNAANNARRAVGLPVQDSSVGDAQRAKTVAASGGAGPSGSMFAPIFEGEILDEERPIPQLSPNYGGGVLNTANSVLDRYTIDQLIQLFGPGVQASYDTLEQDAKRTLGAFDQGIFQIGNNNIEAVKRMQGTAATGQASHAAAGAQGLSALMNTFMDAAPVFTGMNQEMQGLSAKKAEAMANLVPTAMQAKNTQDSNFASLFNSLYAADTQFGVGALDYLGNKYNADKNLEGNKYASDKNLEGTIQQALANIKSSQNYGGGSGGGGSSYNPNASFDGYMSKAEAAVADGDRGAFLLAMTGAGVSTKEALDLWEEYHKKDTPGGNGIQLPEYSSLGTKIKEWAENTGRTFYTDQNGVTKLVSKKKK